MSENKTDVYYVHLFNDYSGSPRVLRDAIEAGNKYSGQTYIFSSSHRGFLDDLPDVKKVNFFYARSNSKYIQLVYFFISQVNLFFILLSYLTMGRIKGNNIVLVVNTMLPFGAAMAGKLMGCRIIYYVHETFIKPDYFKKFLRFFIENCAYSVIFVSEFLKKEEAFVKPRAVVIHNGLRSDFPYIEEIGSVKLSIKYSTKKILFVGSLKSYKGIYELLKVARELKSFQFVAAMNCERAELNAFISANEPPENIMFIARPDDLVDIFMECFLVLNLSLVDECIETFGLTLLEGMALGSPVISPPIGGPVEFVTENNGFLIDSRKTSEIVQFIHHLNSSFCTWKKYSEDALMTSKKFSTEQYKKSYTAYLQGECE
jgi:glycosyltransferase involved in cell wall biosynthesis